AVKKA
ncbi:flavin oxidoreductase / NADH oxidase family protein, partial [Vibrio parahaemolyticus EKP-008]